jgi:hypothetical protein
MHLRGSAAPREIQQMLEDYARPAPSSIRLA